MRESGQTQPSCSPWPWLRKASGRACGGGAKTGREPVGDFPLPAGGFWIRLVERFVLVDHLPFRPGMDKAPVRNGGVGGATVDRVQSLCTFVVCNHS